MLTQISQASKVSVPSMFIIPDTQLSHDSSLCPLLHPVTDHSDIYRASGITLAKNGITVQIPVQPFCVDVATLYSPCSMCVVVVLLTSLNAWMERCLDGWVTGSTGPFLTTDVWNKTLEFDRLSNLKSLEVERVIAFSRSGICLKLNLKNDALQRLNLVQLYKRFYSPVSLSNISCFL